MFEKIRSLGRGRWTEVEEAIDRRLGRRVAVKRLLPEVVDDQPVVECFLAGARRMATVEDAHLLSLLSVESEDGEPPKLILELADGGSLQDRMRGGPVSESEVASILCDLARGLRALHERGWTHGNLHPGNVLFFRSRVKLADPGFSPPDSSGALSDHRGEKTAMISADLEALVRLGLTLLEDGLEAEDGEGRERDGAGGRAVHDRRPLAEVLRRLGQEDSGGHRPRRAGDLVRALDSWKREQEEVLAQPRGESTSGPPARSHRLGQSLAAAALALVFGTVVVLVGIQVASWARSRSEPTADVAAEPPSRLVLSGEIRALVRHRSERSRLRVRADGRPASRLARVGDELVLTVDSAVPGEVLLALVGASGEVTQLYPTSSGERLLISDPPSPVEVGPEFGNGLEVQPPIGDEWLLAAVGPGWEIHHSLEPESVDHGILFFAPATGAIWLQRFLEELDRSDAEVMLVRIEIRE